VNFIAMAAILLVLVIGYIWVTRGFFSALLHLACTIAAGAIAFAVWEPMAYWVLDVAPQRGWLLFFRDTAWGLSLGVPFAVSLVLLRFVMDKVVKANVNCDPRIEYIGGGVCGLFIGILTVGILVISLGSLRFGSEWLGYQPVRYTTKPSGAGKGSLVRDKPAFRPYVDELTAGFYEMVSRGALRPEFGTPLGDLYPNLEEVPGLLRFTYEGKGRNTLKPSDFTWLKEQSYTVGDVQAGSDIEPLMQDAWNPGAKMVAVSIDDAPVTRGHLLGLVLRFGSGAKETGGGSQVVLGPGQLRILAESPSGVKTIFPSAVISQADSASPAMGRWRYDAERIFIASVGGGSDAVMAFEFAIPVGYKPKYLYVKNIRVELTEPETNFSSASLRDGFIRSNRMDPELKKLADEAAGTSGGPDMRDAEIIKFLNPNQQPRPGYISYQEGGFVTGRNIGFIIKKGTERSLKLEEAASGKEQLISEGEEVFSAKEIKENSRALDRQLQIKNLAAPDDVVIVRLDVSNGTRMSMLGRAALGADQSQPPMLVDADGQTYEAVGYVFIDPAVYRLRFTPGSPLANVAEAPPLSKSQSSDTKLQFIFRVSRGVTVVRYQIGNKVIADWSETPIKLMQ
jgi:hypothetical protein